MVKGWNSRSQEIVGPIMGKTKTLGKQIFGPPKTARASKNGFVQLRAGVAARALLR
jgi:hypothetical protein